MKTALISPSPEFEAWLTQGEAPDSPALRQALGQAGLAAETEAPAASPCPKASFSTEAARAAAPAPAPATKAAKPGTRILRRQAGLAPLDPKAIAAGWDLPGQPASLRVYRLLGSTNDEARAWLDEPGTEFRIVLAEAQTAGKGRRGRRWVSPFGRNIYVSVCRFMQRSPEQLGGLSLVMGIQLVEALRDQGVAGAGLKWPNDLLLDGGKTGGILVELRPREPRGTGVIAGIGVNLALSEAEAAGISQPWNQVSARQELDRNRLAASLVSKVAAALLRFDQESFACFQPAWADYNLYQNTEVTVSCGGKRIRGLDRGVNLQGDLLLETADGMLELNSGEVSLRPSAGSPAMQSHAMQSQAP